MKQKVFLISGFQNWGKSYIIQKLFNDRVRFYQHKLYELCGQDFCVHSYSNDDWGENGYIGAINSRLEKLGSTPEYIISAFCPTREKWNDSKRIIETLYKNADIYMIALEHKWCLHAKLNIDELKEYYSDIPNLQIITIDEKDPTKKIQAVKQTICSLLASKELENAQENKIQTDGKSTENL